MAESQGCEGPNHDKYMPQLRGLDAPDMGIIDMNAWKTWSIRIHWNNQIPDNEFKTIQQTVKARNKDEAERKAMRLLSGRFAGVFEVYENTKPAEAG